MSRLQAWLMHVANLAVGGTGLVYAWMRYFAHSTDPFAVVGHPWQSVVQHLHLLAAPLLVFAVGLIWQVHAWAGLSQASAPRRRSGILLVSMAAPMVASGYLLQTATDESWRRAWIGLHLAASGLWLAATLVHQLTPRRRG